MNAYDRLLAEYASWGGWRYYGWGGYEDRATYLGPAVWSERDCDLRLAYELEREFPKAVHMEFPIAKWTRHDFAPPEVVQRVDVVVSDFSGFVDGDEASLVFKEHRHQAFFEVKWCARRAGPGTVASLGPDAYPSLRTCASSPTTSSLDAA